MAGMEKIMRCFACMHACLCNCAAPCCLRHLWRCSMEEAMHCFAAVHPLAACNTRGGYGQAAAQGSHASLCSHASPCNLHSS